MMSRLADVDKLFEIPLEEYWYIGDFASQEEGQQM